MLRVPVPPWPNDKTKNQQNYLIPRLGTSSVGHEGRSATPFRMAQHLAEQAGN